MSDHYKPYITTCQAHTKEIATFAIKIDDFVGRFGGCDSSTERLPTFNMTSVENQINKGSTFGNRVNCQYIYWHNNNELIPRTESTVIDPYGKRSGDAVVNARVLVVHETKDKHGNSITAIFVDTWASIRLARMYLYYWLPSGTNFPSQDCVLPKDLWKQCFNCEEDCAQFIDDVEDKLVKFQEDKTIVMNSNETLYKFY